MKILVACERTQVVTRAFRLAGHEAYSCDLLPAELESAWHIHGDALQAAYSHQWDMMIAHPECTYLAHCGARWFDDPSRPTRRILRDDAIEFWWKLWKAPIKKRAFENPQPSGYMMSRIGRYTQKIQPWQFGDLETKGICLWLHELDRLTPVVNIRPSGVKARSHMMAGNSMQQANRQRFDFPGVIQAMVKTWGNENGRP